ncbi:MAG: phosphatase PAP2 family protein [Clostridia bacterium]|nr:phosphatase PAP2 family protein [Clostridia bacterium]
MLIFCWLAWNGHKTFAHKTGFAFCFGMGINQVLKIIFCVQRPWVLDKRIKASSYALESATGYSFPSGHTQSGVTVFGCLAKEFGNKVFKAVCIFLAVMVGVSRLYFRVHTPWDVTTSFVIGILVILATEKIYKLCDKHDFATLLAGFAVSIAMVIFTLTKPYPAYHLPDYSHDCIKIAGAIGGFIVGWFVERRYIKYKSTGNTLQKIYKTALGLILLIAIKLVFKKFVDETYTVMYIQNFILIFWCIAMYPFLMSKTGPQKKIIKILSVCVLILFILTASLFANSGDVTLAEYNKLHDGISYKEAVRIVGSEGNVVHTYSKASYNTVVYEWYGKEDNSYVSAIFINNQLIGKEKYNLD